MKATRTPQNLRDTLDKVQALMDGAKTDGEREACQAAIDRLEQSLGHYGAKKTPRPKKGSNPAEDSPQAERLRKEWAKEWNASFFPRHAGPSPSFKSALDDYLKEFFEGKPKTNSEHRRPNASGRRAYPKAY